MNGKEGRGRAILSVYDKRGIADFGSFLAGIGLELVSSGGTASALRDKGIEVAEVSDITGSPELMEGRVKTLHPVVHAGILARREREEDLEAIEVQGIAPVDWVVVNLYPFEEALERKMDESQQLEFIDIGGPTMLRAAAKNFHSVVVVSDPSDYLPLREEWSSRGRISTETRRHLAGKVFRLMSSYDAAVADYLASRK